MNCHALLNVLDLHAEGRLTPRRAAAVAAHLAGCAACRARAEAAAPAAVKPAVRAPDSLKAKLLAAVQSAPGAPAEARAPDAAPLWPREARGIALAAALLVLVGLLAAYFGAPSQSGAAVAAAEDL